MLSPLVWGGWKKRMGRKLGPLSGAGQQRDDLSRSRVAKCHPGWNHTAKSLLLPRTPLSTCAASARRLCLPTCSGPVPGPACARRDGPGGERNSGPARQPTHRRIERALRRFCRWDRRTQLGRPPLTGAAGVRARCRTPPPGLGTAGGTTAGRSRRRRSRWSRKRRRRSRTGGRRRDRAPGPSRTLGLPGHCLARARRARKRGSFASVP